MLKSGRVQRWIYICVVLMFIRVGAGRAPTYSMSVPISPPYLQFLETYSVV